MQSSTPTANLGHPFGFVGAYTAGHLVLILLIAALVVSAMLYGARLARRRAAALKEEQARLDAYDAEHPDAPAVMRSGEPAVPAEPVTTSVGQEEQRPPVPAPPSPPADPADTQVPPAFAAGTGAPAPVTAPVSDASPANGPVTQLKGLGPKVAARLAELGITTVGQIAALDDEAADALDARLGPFQGRVARDRWIEQARFLAAGDRAGFEAVFGRL